MVESHMHTLAAEYLSEATFAMEEGNEQVAQAFIIMASAILDVLAGRS